MATRKVVTVNEFAIAELVRTDVGAYGNNMGRRIMGVARGIAPRRSGQLAGSHRYAGFLYRGRYKIGTRVENTAPHALWVHEGTTGPIFPHAPRLYLVIPRSEMMTSFSGIRARTPRMGAGRVGRSALGGFSSPFAYAKSVRGQAAQPWLREAGETVAFRAANFSFA